MTKKSVYDIITTVSDDVNAVLGFKATAPGLESCASDVKEWIPTTSPLLNLLLGEEHYGVPSGRIIEVFGDFSHGKSTVLQLLINAWQAAGGITNLIDSEAGWDRDRALVMGHNPRRHLSVEVDTVEGGFKAIQALMQKYDAQLAGAVPILYAWDTISSAQTEGEQKDDEYESGMMFKARFIRKELRRLVRELPKHRSSAVFVSQTIEGPKSNRGHVKTTSGGGGLKFHASIRLQVDRVGMYKDPETKKPIGIVSKVETVKNKLFPPFKHADLLINWRQGSDAPREVLNYLLDNTNVANVAGAYKRIVGFAEEDITFFEKSYASVLESNPGLYDWLVEQVKAHWCGI